MRRTAMPEGHGGEHLGGRHGGAPHAVRFGRPPRGRAGEVDARILDAARQVFLERGLAGASLDEIAGLAHAGKPTIYARFPSKEALYAAVVMRNVDTNIARFENDAPPAPTLDERLTQIAAGLLRWALVGDTIGLLRLAISEAPRFPDLASCVHNMAHARAEEAIARLLGEAAQTDALGATPAFSAERLPATTRFFLDLTFLPLVFRALLGERLEVLCAEIGPHVARCVALFLAACHGDAVAV